MPTKKTKKVSPFTMQPTAAYESGANPPKIIGWKAGVYDAEGYLCAFGLNSQMFGGQAEIMRCWGNRPPLHGLPPDGERLMDWGEFIVWSQDQTLDQEEESYVTDSIESTG